MVASARRPQQREEKHIKCLKLLGTVPRTSDKTNTTSNESNVYCTPSVYYAVQKQLLYESLTPLNEAKRSHNYLQNDTALTLTDPALLCF